MKILPRTIQEHIEKYLFKGKIIIVYGARQVGKTTLIRMIQNKYQGKSVYINCDEPDVRRSLTDVTSTEIREFIGDSRLVFIDEAQRVRNIGITLKLMTDNFPHIQVIATGSSSFDLSNEVAEPLTGRKYEFVLYPLSIEELSAVYSDVEIRRLLEKRIIYGMYPEIVQDTEDSENNLRNISQSYLYKDALQYQNIKNPEILEKLLQVIALQTGNEVSYNELSATVGIDKKTVSNYIQILEKAFVIFRLLPYSRNLRNELRKLRKIYFVDTGIRNALINNFNPMDLRLDGGSLWENFMISERIKRNSNHGIFKNAYFWRTHSQQEIDCLEEAQGKLEGFEIKWNKKKVRMPRLFMDTYPRSSVRLVNKDNFREFVMP